MADDIIRVANRAGAAWLFWIASYVDPSVVPMGYESMPELFLFCSWACGLIAAADGTLIIVRLVKP